MHMPYGNKKLLTQKSNELLMSLHAGIHMNDGQCESLLNYDLQKKRLRKPPYKLQAARLCKTTVSIKQV